MQVLPPWMDRQGMDMRRETNVDDGCSHEDFTVRVLLTYIVARMRIPRYQNI